MDVKTVNSLVAATFEKANTYVFAALIIRDREVGASGSFTLKLVGPFVFPSILTRVASRYQGTSLAQR